MILELMVLMGKMFLMMAAGYVLRRMNIITDAGKKCLTDLILDLVLPCNIIRAFLENIGGNSVTSFALALGIATLGQFLSLLVANLCYRDIEPGQQAVFQYCSVCSNAGFLGNPMAEGIFGSLGLAYASTALIPQRIVMWTAGVSYFQKNTTNKKELYKKVLLHPCMLATYIGFVLMILGITLPEMINGTIKSFSSCCTPMTMLYIGTILVGCDIKSLLTKNQIRFAVIRLVLLPMILMVICLLLHVDRLVMGVCVILAAMPAGSTSSLLAAKYGADEVSAAKAVVFTTLLSVITTPIWGSILLSLQ